MLTLSDGGMTFAEIARRHNISTSRAGEIIRKERRRQAFFAADVPFRELSVRAANRLVQLFPREKDEPLEPRPEDVAALDPNKIRGAGCGETTMIEIAAWLKRHGHTSRQWTVFEFVSDEVR